MLRDGPALAIPDRDGETGPVARLWRKIGEQHRQLLRWATLVVCLLDAKMPEVLADTHHETNNFQ